MISQSKASDYDWYKLGTTIIGVREKRSGGFSIKTHQYGDPKTFKTLLDKIIDYYRYQFLTYDTRGLSPDFKNILVKRGFKAYQRNPLAFQERPLVGQKVLIAIKPYVGRYESGIIKKVLTSKGFHPRGFKVMLNDKNQTVGRIATIRKKGHKH